MAIKDLYKLGRPVISFEIFPPKKDTDIERIYEIIGRMCALSPDFISVTYGAGGSGSVNKTTELTSYIQQQYGIEALAHLVCVGANKEKINNLLDEMSAKGVQNVLALRGDLPENEALSGKYQYAEELIQEIRRHKKFCIGAACYPEGHIDCLDDELDIRYLRKKQEASADFLITQLFFDNDIFFRFLERAEKAGITLPISAGVMPMLGQSQIERMVFMCGASLPSAIIKLLNKYEKNPEDLRKAGIEYAAKQLEGLLKNGVQGVHIYTMNRPEIVEYCMGYIGRV